MTPATAPARLEVGRVGRPHGLAGDLLIDFVTDRVADRTAVGARLWADGRPLEVVAARPHKGRWLVRFAGIEDRSGAERLVGSVLEAVPVEDPDAVFVHQLIGRRLGDQHGVDHGPVVSVIENPAADLLELDDGRLVPLTFLAERADDALRVVVPVGLLDGQEAEG